MHPSLASGEPSGRNWGGTADAVRPGQEVSVVRKPVVLITGASGEIGHGLIERLAREGRSEIAQACFDFLPARARLDLAGWPTHDIFSHE